MPAALFTLLLTALAATGALLTPSPLFAALAAWITWTAFVALSFTDATRNTRRWARLALLPTAAASAIFFIAYALVPSAFSFTSQPSSLSSQLPPNSPLLLPTLLLAAFAGFFLQTHATLRARTLLPSLNSQPSTLNSSISPSLNSQPSTPNPSATTAALLKLNTLLFATTAALLFAESQFALTLQRPWSFLLIALTAFWILETATRAIGRLYQPPRFARALPPVASSLLLHPLLTPTERAAWKTPPPSDSPTLALADMWFLPTLRRLALPLIALAGLLAWLSTAFHEVPVGHVGLHARFGRMQDEPLTAGFHLTLPAPFHQLTVLPAERLQRVVLGFEADTGQPILWDRGHYIGEQSQLVGSGEDLLTISVPIYFYIRDPVAFHRHTIDAARTIRDLAAQQLLSQTIRRSAFAIMTTERDALADSLHRELQSALDRHDSGLSIALVCLRDIHPPVSVSPAYQEVVSALEDRESYRHEGEDYRGENLPRARSDAAQLRTSADGEALARLAKTHGETARFTALLASYQASPEIFSIRQRYALFDESLRGVKKLIVDDTFRGRLPTVVDIRKTLNPDFAPPPTPDNASLLPLLTSKRTDFDRTIDGYLNSGRGAIPAMNPQAPDPDNLLNPTHP